MRKHDPDSHARLVVHMQEMRDLLSSQEDLSSRLNLWVLNGALEHGLSMVYLKEIAEKYAKIGVVPSTYFLPELFRTN